MSAQAHMTYVGACVFSAGSSSGFVLPCSHMSDMLDQKVLFYDHVLGLTDRFVGGVGSALGAKKADSNTSMPSGSMTAGSGGVGNIQKKIYRASPAIAKASISGPIPSEGFQSVIDAAVAGSVVSVGLTYWKKDALSVGIGGARIASLSLDLKAGDVANYSMEIVGTTYSPSYTPYSASMDCMKLVTWDACTVNTIVGDISSFNLSINNPTIPIYTAAWSAIGDSSGGMMPQKIRLGIQEVTGSIGSYDPVTVHIGNPGSIAFNMGGQGQSLSAIFSSPKDEGGGGPYIRSISFVGAADENLWHGNI